MALESFNAYHSYLTAIEPLNDAERGRLFTALLTYSSTGEVPDLRGNERFVFPQMKWQIDRDKGSYNDFCARQSENGKKGGRPKKPPVNSETQKTQAFSEKPKKANDKDKDKDKEDLPASSKEDARPSDAGRSAERAVIDAWNSLGLNPIRSVNQGSDRKRILASRITNDGVPAILEAIENVRRSPFLNGQSKGSFTATFDWFIKPSNFQKVLEGRYNDAPQKSSVSAGSAPSGRRDDSERLERILANLQNEKE